MAERYVRTFKSGGKTLGNIPISQLGGAAGGGKGPYTYLVEMKNSDITVYDNQGNTAYGPVTSASAALQWAINAAHDVGGGTIIAKDLEVPEGLTHYADVLVREYYKGTGREFRVFPDGHLYVLGLQPYIIDRPCIPQFETRGSISAVIFKNGYLTIAMRDDATETGEVMIMGTIGYGTYQWKGKAEGAESGMWIFLGFAEEFPIQWKDSIFLWWNGSSWIFQTNKAGSQTNTTISGIDFTVEHTFKVVWSSTDVYLYIDEAEVAHHTTNIPTVRMVPFLEISRSSGGTSHAYVYGKDWVKLS